MRIPIALFLVAYAATAAGLLVTSPVKNQEVDLAKPLTIKWESVKSDPSTFSIYLVNPSKYPNIKELVAESVNAANGHYTWKDRSAVNKGSGYQINLVSNSPRNSGILAQSQKFTVTKSESSVNSSSVSSRTMTTMTGSTMTTGSMTATATTTSNAAGFLMAPAQAGSFLLGLAALAL